MIRKPTPLRETMERLQKAGMTFSEIASRLGLTRNTVVNELFWKRYGR